MTTRRTFLVTGAAAATALAIARPAGAQPAAGLRAAVLEFRDPWTKATGLADLLTHAGVKVAPLDAKHPLVKGMRVILTACVLVCMILSARYSLPAGRLG